MSIADFDRFFGGGPEVKITEIHGEWNGEPVRFKVDGYGDCTAHIGRERCHARVENIGLVNPFAIRLLMEGLGVALSKPPEERMLRVTGERPQWTPGGSAVVGDEDE